MGVCGGLAEYLNIDPTLVRIVSILIMFSGIGFFVYIVAALIMPEDKGYPDNDQWGSNYGTGSGSYTNTGSDYNTGTNRNAGSGSNTGAGNGSNTGAGNGSNAGAGYDSGFESEFGNSAGDWDRPAKYGNDKTKVVLGTILVGFGVLFLCKQILPPGLFDLKYFVPLLLICIGGIIVFKGRK